MTNREFLNLIVSANLSEDATAHAQSLLAQMDKRNAKRAATPSKTAVANEPIKAAIAEYLANGSKTASEVGTALEISTQKASALLRQMTETGIVSVADVKVPKKGTQKSYTLVVG